MKILASAVDVPCLHYENGILNAEIFDDLVASNSRTPTRSLVEFDERNLFWWGESCGQYPDGRLDGAGDLRRGGLSVVCDWISSRACHPTARSS